MVKKYKIALVGFGSIGKRHLTNINHVLEEKGIGYSVDLIRREISGGVQKPFNEMVSKIYLEQESIPDDYDVIFITNPTHLHYDSIKRFGSKAKNLFIEKPVFDRTSVDLSTLPFTKGGVYYVACPLRYTEVIQYIKKTVDTSLIYCVRAISSSYLPDWRPSIDYRKTYSSHYNQGGGVSLDLIHEWDYLTYLFGKPNKVYNLRGKFSGLEIDSDDLSIYIARYENMLAEVHLDYFGRAPIRELQLFMRDKTLVVDILNSEIRFTNDNKVVRFNEDSNSCYLKEIDNFFEVLEGKKNNENDICTALGTLETAMEGMVK